MYIFHCTFKYFLDIPLNYDKAHCPNVSKKNNLTYNPNN